MSSEITQCRTVILALFLFYFYSQILSPLPRHKSNFFWFFFSNWISSSQCFFAFVFFAKSQLLRRIFFLCTILLTNGKKSHSMTRIKSLFRTLWQPKQDWDALICSRGKYNFSEKEGKKLLFARCGSMYWLIIWSKA